MHGLFLFGFGERFLQEPPGTVVHVQFAFALLQDEDAPTAPTTTRQPPVDAFTLVLRERAGQQLDGFLGAWPSADPLFVTLGRGSSCRIPTSTRDTARRRG